MNKFIVDEQANGLLERWRIANADAIRKCISESAWFFKRFEIVFKAGGTDGFSGFCERHNSYFEIKLYKRSTRLATVKIRQSDKPREDVVMQMLPNKELVDMNDPNQYQELRALLQQVTFNALSVNALLLVGNLVEPSDRVVKADSVEYRGGDRTFVFRPYKDTCYAVSSGSHRSPDGVFPVRGHFRQYKDGKIIWIDSFFKGLGKD